MYAQTIQLLNKQGHYFMEKKIIDFTVFEDKKWLVRPRVARI